MATPTREIVEPRKLASIADRIRVEGGRFPGGEIVDLHSPEGRVGLEIAREAPGWTVYTSQPGESPPDNVEEIASFEAAGFEDGQLGGIVGTWLTEPIEAFRPERLASFHDALTSEGRIVFMFRGPSSRNEAVQRTIPPQAVDMLTEAGFEHAMETARSVFPDGSRLVRLRAIKP